MSVPPPIDPKRAAILVIDMQRDFLDPGAPIAGSTSSRASTG